MHVTTMNNKSSSDFSVRACDRHNSQTSVRPSVAPSFSLTACHKPEINTKHAPPEETIPEKLLMFLYRKLGTELSKNLYIWHTNYSPSTKLCISENFIQETLLVWGHNLLFCFNIEIRNTKKPNETQIFECFSRHGSFNICAILEQDSVKRYRSWH
jgi:hypothetical protein